MKMCRIYDLAIPSLQCL